MERDEFIKTYTKYQLGHLPTEQQHPLTKNLSELAQSDLASAYKALQQVDLEALTKLQNYAEGIEELRGLCKETIGTGAKVYICGCGATGRLALTIESLWRQKFETDQVVAFMAGGDIALVHSLEGFEDYPDYGKRHLLELGFSKNDLLIAVTEGGETPYVLGAVEAALEISDQAPQLLYCNPDTSLMDSVERSQRVLANPRVRKYSLFVGPMALSGSTRMQASTVLQLAVGLALVDTEEPVASQLVQLTSWLKNTVDYAMLSSITQKEADIYAQREFVMYVPRVMAVSVFTDTTERSPTFNLPAFSPPDDLIKIPSLCYIMLPAAQNQEEAWQSLLGRSPRSLNWSDVSHLTEESYLKTFDFSKHALEKREEPLGAVRQYIFEIDCREQTFLWSLGGVEVDIAIGEASELIKHTYLKMLLNAHSTLVMGLMGRYKSNLMTWVTATNGKLIDRACRYVAILLSEENLNYEYLEIVEAIFKIKPTLEKEECLVIKTVEHLKKNQPT